MPRGRDISRSHIYDLGDIFTNLNSLNLQLQGTNTHNFMYFITDANLFSLTQTNGRQSYHCFHTRPLNYPFELPQTTLTPTSPRQTWSELSFEGLLTNFFRLLFGDYYLMRVKDASFSTRPLLLFYKLWSFFWSTDACGIEGCT